MKLREAGWTGKQGYLLHAWACTHERPSITVLTTLLEFSCLHVAVISLRARSPPLQAQVSAAFNSDIQLSYVNEGISEFRHSISE